MTIRDIAISFGYEVDKATEKKANDSIKSLKSTATKLLGAIGIGFSLVALKDLSEEFNGINDKINYATKGLGEMDEIHEKILSAANDVKQSYSDMGNTVSKLVQGNKELFSDVDSAVQFATLTNKAFLAAGKSSQEANALQTALNMSMAKGQMDSRTLMAMFKEAPELIGMMADSLGVSTDQFQEMVSKGKVSAAQLRDAFVKNTDTINAAFDGLDYSISDAMLNIRNQWGLYLDKLNSTYGITQKIAKIMVRGFNAMMTVIKKLQTYIERLSNKLGGLSNLLKLVGIIGGSLLVLINAEKIMVFVRGLGVALGKINLKMIAIVAIIAILALLVDDFINFMQGNDSLMGELFEKMGIDGDEVRNTVNGLMNTVKGFIPIIKDFAKQIGAKLLDAVKKVLPLLLDMGKKVIPLLVNLIKQIIPFLVQIAERILPFIIQLISDLLPFVFQIIQSVLPVLIELITMIIPILMQIIESVLPVIISLIETLLPIVLQIIETVLPIILELIETLLPLIMQIVEAVLPVILELLESILPVIIPIVELIANLAQTLLPPIVSLLGSILPILQPILGVLGPISDILGVIIGSIAKVVGWVAQGLTWVIDLFTGNASSPNVGSEPPEQPTPTPGYASGTNSTPDTFIAGENGPELITGAKGRKVFTSEQTDGIFGALSALNGAGTARPQTAAVASSSVENKVVNQTVSIRNEFNGDRAGQQKSAEAMEKAGEDVTSQLARGLAYAS